MSNINLGRGGFPEFSTGRITVSRRPFVITFWESHPLIAGYLDVFNPTTYDGNLPVGTFTPVGAFTAGRIRVYFPHSVEFALLPGRIAMDAGSIHITDSALPDTGAVTDFAAWPTVARDPAEFYVQTTTTGSSGAVGAAWTRHYAQFAVARGSAPFSRVAYIGVGARFLSVPTVTKQHLSQVQVEATPVDGGSYPTAYSTAREVRTVIRPDRLNLSTNPSFEVDASSWISGGGSLTAPTSFARSTTRGKFGTASGLVTWSASVLQGIRQTVTNLVVGQTYYVSAYVFTPAGGPDVLIHYTDTLPATTDYAAIPARRAYARDQWTRIWTSFVATATSTTVNLFTAAAPTNATTTYVDGLLVEKGVGLKDYFDGSAAFGGDTLWEVGGTAGNTRSYLYKNRAERYAAVVRILNSNVPMGIGIATPQFGVLPVE